MLPRLTGDRGKGDSECVVNVSRTLFLSDFNANEFGMVRSHRPLQAFGASPVSLAAERSVHLHLSDRAFKRNASGRMQTI